MATLLDILHGMMEEEREKKMPTSITTITTLREAKSESHIDDLC